ncbi:DUF2784 domain-containing protein [Aquincola sp. S2]|uniref:DUF2784 domain-containing protein n=1 Tax=Pseudaquabacterium terrae TaxID=2732868 RepID=A0ABX2EPB7_9BURK|nr:DUF2784 domain-containing protein [Aquabacterium terrae]NRF70391.1 DUF2784 domain-containing protein [Aquabacterium terrae]
MWQRAAADAVLLLHGAFIVFAVFGGLLVLRWRRAAWLHLPAAAWGVFVEASGTLCPLTTLENRLRMAAGDAGYAGGFVERYLLPLIYPEALTRELQWWLAGFVLVINLLVYGAVICYGRRLSRQPPADR